MVVQDQSMDHEEISRLLAEGWSISRRYHGSELSVHLPGMFVIDGIRGQYRAVSITGSTCELQCEHCKGTLLRSMPQAQSPDMLYRIGMEAHARGDLGMLVTGGCDSAGKLPWAPFLPTIKKLTETTGLLITVHPGVLNEAEARALKEAGVSQALVDVIGDDETAKDVYHLSDGTAAIRRTLEALAAADLEIVPHILFGLHYGQEKGEWQALLMLKDVPVKQYVVVVLMPTKGTSMAQVTPPSPEQAACFLARARQELPRVRAQLGCARPRGLYRQKLDVLAIRAGINAIAIPCDAALEEAQSRGLTISYTQGCCSLAGFRRT